MTIAQHTIPFVLKWEEMTEGVDTLPKLLWGLFVFIIYSIVYTFSTRIGNLFILS